MGRLIALVAVVYFFVNYEVLTPLLVGSLFVIGVGIAIAFIASLPRTSTAPEQEGRVVKKEQIHEPVVRFVQQPGEGMGHIRTGLVIDEPWVSKIISGEKIWEMRSTGTAKRERIALIKKGSGTIVGIATVKDVLGPFSDSEISTTFAKHRVPFELIGKWRYAWVLDNVRSVATPVPYVHKSGAVTWVTLNSMASLEISAADSEAN